MFITQVEYKELFSPPGGHNNFTFGAVSDIGEGEDPDVVLADLKFYVRDQLKKDHREYQSIMEKKWVLESDCLELERKVQNLMREHRDQVAALNGTLEQIMVHESLPF